MAEEYSEVWVTIHCSEDPQMSQEAINDAWEEILKKYQSQGVENDTGSMIGVENGGLNPQIEDNTVRFGLGSHARDGGPHYQEQYQAMGEMIRCVQKETLDLDTEIEVQKTGASG